MERETVSQVHVCSANDRGRLGEDSSDRDGGLRPDLQGSWEQTCPVSRPAGCDSTNSLHAGGGGRLPGLR